MFRASLVLTSFKTAPHNRYQPHPAEPEHRTNYNNSFENVDISHDIFTTHCPTKKDVTANIYVFPLVTNQYTPSAVTGPLFS